MPINDGCWSTTEGFEVIALTAVIAVILLRSILADVLYRDDSPKHAAGIANRVKCSTKPTLLMGFALMLHHCCTRAEQGNSYE